MCLTHLKLFSRYLLILYISQVYKYHVLKKTIQSFKWEKSQVQTNIFISLILLLFINYSVTAANNNSDGQYRCRKCNALLYTATYLCESCQTIKKTICKVF
jgi:hypothetical protein